MHIHRERNKYTHTLCRFDWSFFHSESKIYCYNAQCSIVLRRIQTQPCNNVLQHSTHKCAETCDACVCLLLCICVCQLLSSILCWANARQSIHLLQRWQIFETQFHLQFYWIFKLARKSSYLTWLIEGFFGEKIICRIFSKIIIWAAEHSTLAFAWKRHHSIFNFRIWCRNLHIQCFTCGALYARPKLNTVTKSLRTGCQINCANRNCCTMSIGIIHQNRCVQVCVCVCKYRYIRASRIRFCFRYGFRFIQIANFLLRELYADTAMDFVL